MGGIVGHHWTTRNTKALEWLEELCRRVTVLREAMVNNVRTAQERHRCCGENFQEGRDCFNQTSWSPE